MPLNFNNQLTKKQEELLDKFKQRDNSGDISPELLESFLLQMPWYLGGNETCEDCGFAHKRDGAPFYNLEKKGNKWKGALKIAPFCRNHVNIFCRYCGLYTTYIVIDGMTIILGYCGKCLDYEELLKEFSGHFINIGEDFEHLVPELIMFFKYLLAPLLIKHGKIEE